MPSQGTERLEKALSNLTVEHVRIAHASSVMGHYFNSPELAAAGVDIWKDHFDRGGRKQMLPLIYVANDVVQKYRPVFAPAFLPVLTYSFPEAVRNLPPQRGSLEKVFNVWRDRKIFPAAGLNELRSRAGFGQSDRTVLDLTNPPQKRKRPASPPNSPRSRHGNSADADNTPMSSEERQRLVALEIQRSLDPLKVSLQFLVDYQKRIKHEQGELEKVLKSSLFERVQKIAPADGADGAFSKMSSKDMEAADADAKRLLSKFQNMHELLQEVAAVEPLCVSHVSAAANVQAMHKKGERARAAELVLVEEAVAKLTETQPDTDVVEWVKRTVRRKIEPEVPKESAQSSSQDDGLGAVETEDDEDNEDMAWDPISRTYRRKSSVMNDDWRDHM